MIKILKNFNFAEKFLLGMSAVYAAVALFNYPYVSTALILSIKNFLRLLPLLVVVFGMIFIVNLFLKPEAIKKHLGQESGKKGWLYAILGSILISAPPYVIFPMLKELKGYGMRYSLMSVFLNNRHVQPALLPMMVYYFGLSFTIIISFYILIFAILNGKIIEITLDSKKHQN